MAVNEIPEELMDLRDEIFREVNGKLDSSELIDKAREEQKLVVEAPVKRTLDKKITEQDLELEPATRSALEADVIKELIGYGPLEDLLADDEVTEIMVNGPNEVFVERNGQIEKAGVSFNDQEQLMGIIQKMVAPLGRRIDWDQPYVDGRLPDGSRINATIPPAVLQGPTLTVRKFQDRFLELEELVENRTLNRKMAGFLKRCVKARLNIAISGGTSTGKTTLLNALSQYIPDDERIITIEDSVELNIQQENLLQCETRNPDVDGEGEITARDLVRNALRMRPDRIIVGECRGGEALDMMQAMNTGHDGSLTTIHANNPRETLFRLETMVMMAGMELPHEAIRNQIVKALDLIVHLRRYGDGERKVITVSELKGTESGTPQLNEIYTFEESAMGSVGGKGQFKPLGIRPGFSDKFDRENVELPGEFFS